MDRYIISWDKPNSSSKGSERQIIESDFNSILEKFIILVNESDTKWVIVLVDKFPKSEVVLSYIHRGE